MSKTSLSLQQVRFSYAGRDWELSVPNLELGRERVTCLIGPNGSGKSTLLQIAAGILLPLKGSVCFGEQPLSSMSRKFVARKLGYLPQQTPALFDYTVRDVVRMGRYAHARGLGFFQAGDERAVAQALEALDMTALQDRPLSQLSGGEQKRAFAASVVAQQPDLMLLDEPTSSLDLHHAASLMRLLSEFGEGGPAVVVVTHDISLASLFGDRLILLQGGRIVADGCPCDVVRPGVMRLAYGDDMLVEQHPENGMPVVLPKGRQL